MDRCVPPLAIRACRDGGVFARSGGLRPPLGHWCGSTRPRFPSRDLSCPSLRVQAPKVQASKAAKALAAANASKGKKKKWSKVSSLIDREAWSSTS